MDRVNNTPPSATMDRAQTDLVFEVGRKYERIAHGWKWETPDGAHYHYDLDSPVIITMKTLREHIARLEDRISRQGMSQNARITDIGSRVHHVERRVGDASSHHVEIYERLGMLHDAIVEPGGTIDGTPIYKRLTDLGHKADGAHLRLDVLNRESSAPGVDLLAKVDNLHDRINDVHKRIDALDHSTEVREAVKRLADGVRFTKSKPGPDCIVQFEGDSRRRTIKGGWLNVYRSREGESSVGSLHETRALADSREISTAHFVRVACIQIPDIIEGEGL